MSNYPDSCYSDETEYSYGEQVQCPPDKLFRIVILLFCFIQVMIDAVLMGKILGVGS